jgi:hypothetical protein
MGWVAPVLTALGAGLELLAEREKNWSEKKALALQQKLNRIEKEWSAEYNKDPSRRSDAVLDNLEFELRQCAEEFATLVRASHLANKSGLIGV